MIVINTPFWMKQLKKSIPDWLMAMRYGRINQKKNSGEFVITAER